MNEAAERARVPQGYAVGPGLRRLKLGVGGRGSVSPPASGLFWVSFAELGVFGPSRENPAPGAIVLLQ